MPTGLGKSLCYQLPALLLDGVAVVISPLISLMKDQYDSLVKINYPATYLNSSLSLAETRERRLLIESGDVRLVYVAPERLLSDSFVSLLSDINISFLAIDEAHCISEWGHDFRPTYRNILPLLRKVEVPSVVALTATATPDVQRDIVSVLDMSSPNVIVSGFDRPNLRYHTEYTSKKIDKVDRVLSILGSLSPGSVIIYCNTRNECEMLNNRLLDSGIRSIIYHGGLAFNVRKNNQERFINGDVDVVVATNAFGMGIDKPDVRVIIHYNIPGSIEAYYQEVGRAGRDGLPSSCHLFLHYPDIRVQE